MNWGNRGNMSTTEGGGTMWPFFTWYLCGNISSCVARQNKKKIVPNIYTCSWVDYDILNAKTHLDLDGYPVQVKEHLEAQHGVTILSILDLKTIAYIARVFVTLSTIWVHSYAIRIAKCHLHFWEAHGGFSPCRSSRKELLDHLIID